MIQRKPQEAYSEFCPFFILKRELPTALAQAVNAGDETHCAQGCGSVADATYIGRTGVTHEIVAQLKTTQPLRGGAGILNSMLKFRTAY